MYWASWPAPERIRRWRAPAALAARSTASTTSRAGGDEGVVADTHRRRPGMVLDAVDRQPRPRDGDDSLDHTHREPVLLQQRSLLDVELEVGAERAGDAGLGAEVADPLELVDETDPVLVPRVVGVLEGDLARHHAAGDHGRLKARSLLVGEDRQGDWMARPDLLVVQRPDHLEAAEDAELSVVPAAGRHRVHMGAHYHRRERRLARALAEDIPHLVDPHGEARLAHPRDHPVAATLVLIGERQASEPSPRCLADPPQVLDRLLQAAPVDLHTFPPGPSPKALDTRA